MSADLDRRLRGAAATPSAPIDPDALMARARIRRTRRRATRSALAIALLLGVGALVPRLAGGSLDFAFGGPIAVLPLPAAGEVAPEFLPDGTPVFVTHLEAGTVTVVRATARYGIAELGVAWCPPGRRFLSEWSGSQFTTAGAWAGGPDPHGLLTYEIEVREHQVLVLSERAPAPRQAGQPPLAGVIDDCWGREVLDRSVVVDHGWLRRSAVLTPEEALAQAPAGPVLVRGILVEYADGHAGLCSRLARTQPAACPDNELRLEARRARGTATWSMEVLAQGVVRDGQFHDVLIAAVLREVDVHDGRRTGQQAPPHTEGPLRLEGQVLYVPAFDLGYGDAPEEPIPAGRYEIRMDNSGAIRHSLLTQLPSGAWRMEAAAGARTARSITLAPGAYDFWCDLPGHREAGMRFTLRVR